MYPQRSGSLRTPRSRPGSADDGGCRGGLLSLVTPSPSQTAASSPSRPRGQGARGEWGSLRLPWRDQGSRNQGSGIRSGAGSRARRGRGGGDESGGVQGAGARALPGAASRLFLQAPPLPPPRPLSAARLFQESPLPQPLASRSPAALLDPGNQRRVCDPSPERWHGDPSIPGLARPPPKPELFPSSRLAETDSLDPRDGGVQFFRATDLATQNQWNLGTGKIDVFPPRAARRESHP